MLTFPPTKDSFTELLVNIGSISLFSLPRYAGCAIH